MDNTADTPAAPEGWTVRSASDADWALERIAAAQREIAEAEEQFRAAVKRLEERRDALLKAPARTVEFFHGHLRMWAEGNREAICSGKRKSRAFIHGRVGWRTAPLKLEVVDSGPLRQWAHGLELVREELDEPGIRAHFKATGEVPPGCKATGGDERFYTSTEGEE